MEHARVWLLASLVVAAGVLAAVARADEDEPAPPPVTVVPMVPTDVALPPMSPPVGGLMEGGFVTRLSNVVQPNGEPLVFDHVVGGDAWSPDAPSVLTVPASGWWRVGVNLTTLGLAYEGPSNSDVAISVVRNWDRAVPYLHATVAFQTFENDPTGWNAEGNSLLQAVYLEAGDRLEVVLRGGPGGLLVESNPSDGVPNGFPTDQGPGTLSPHFFLLPL